MDQQNFRRGYVRDELQANKMAPQTIRYEDRLGTKAINAE